MLMPGMSNDELGNSVAFFFLGPVQFENFLVGEDGQDGTRSRRMLERTTRRWKLRRTA